MAESVSPENHESRVRDVNTPRIRRRNRMITSCLECRRRKLKCDKLHPCTNCNKFSRECMFLAPALDSVSQKKLNELKDKMGSLEKVLENDIARKGDNRRSSTSSHSPGDLPGEDSGDDCEVAVPEDEKPLEPNALAVTDAAYEDTASEDHLDLGVWLGKMRLTERFGGTFRPRFAEEVGSSLGEPINTDMNDHSVRRLSERKDFLAPGPTFISPGSGFMFGDVGPRRNLIDFLPSKSAADNLVQNYYKRVHFIARVLHWPSFQLQYESFWNNVLSGYEPQPSLQAVVFAVLFAAAASMEDDNIYTLFGSDKASVQTNFQTATEVALGKAHFLRTTKIETLQALVIYLIPMIRDEISRAHSVLVGCAIRLAECMGLHRDPEVFGMSPIGTHVRRILWFQLCYLDFRTAESQAPRPYIKRDNYDTRFPLDINDLDLMTPEPTETVGIWTDMTLSRLRFECTEMWRVVTGDAERLRMKKISITHVLGKVESFRRAMEAKYHPVLDTKIPIQAFARHFLGAAMARMHVAVLHRFHHSVRVQIPDRLREILITSAIDTMENFIMLQKAPEFRDWSWYSRSVITWNPAMLLLLDAFVYPQRREADRIWAIIDYTFEPDLQLTRDQKARQILRTIRDRVAYYRDMRRMREPVDMPSRHLLTVRMREQRDEQRHGTVGVNSILLKEEEIEVPLQSIRSASTISNGNASRKQSLNGTQPAKSTTIDMSQPRQPEGDSWTFDTQHTQFLAPGPGLTQETTPNSRPSSISPGPFVSSTLPKQRSIAQVFNPIPGLDHSFSPGSSSSVADAWPPPISNDQQGWGLKQLQSGMHDTHRMSGSAPSNGQLPNNYLPHGMLPGQLSFANGGLISVEAMLQPPNPGFQQDDAMSLEIDWGEWDKIFPPEVNTGNLNNPQVAVQ